MTVLLVCGCAPPDSLCPKGQNLVKLAKRGAMLKHQKRISADLNAALIDWADHIYTDVASGVALLPKGTL